MFTLGTRAEYLGRDSVWVNEPRTLKSSFTFHFTSSEGRTEVTLWDILILAEGDLAPVSCLQENAAVCERAAACRTLPVWEDYYKLTKDYFRGITLEDLMRQQR